MSRGIKNQAGEVIKAGCVVVSGNQVLLVTTRERDLWAFPKGHAENGETMEQVALRETLEETGYQVEIVKSLPDLTYVNGKTREPIRVSMFFARPAAKTTNKTDEIAEWRTLDEARELLIPNLRPYLEDID